jgi:hypothetical protein
VQRFEGSGDQVFPALAEDLDGDIAGDPVFLDQAAGEIKFDLGGGGKSDLDLLESDPDQKVKKLQLFLDAHRLGEGLISVPEVDAAPDRGSLDCSVGPLSIR